MHLIMNHDGMGLLDANILLGLITYTMEEEIFYFPPQTEASEQWRYSCFMLKCRSGSPLLDYPRI
jgi:hypothetical protein